jgi:hypothetical protein
MLRKIVSAFRRFRPKSTRIEESENNNDESSSINSNSKPVVNLSNVVVLEEKVVSSSSTNTSSVSTSNGNENCDKPAVSEVVDERRRRSAERVGFDVDVQIDDVFDKLIDFVDTKPVVEIKSVDIDKPTNSISLIRRSRALQEKIKRDPKSYQPVVVLTRLDPRVVDRIRSNNDN